MDATAKAPTTPTTSRPGRQPGHTARGAAQRAALVQAAFDLIAERGFEGLRTRDIAARAGVNIATLHYYFVTKEVLIRAVVDELTMRFRTRHVPYLAAQPQLPLVELRQELEDAQYQVRESPDMFVVLIELLARSSRDPAIKAIMRNVHADWTAHISSYLHEGVEQGVFPADLDVAATAAGLVALVMGSAIQMLTDPGAFPAERFNREVERWITGHACAESA